MPDIPLLLGHRGARASTGVRENTIPSFDLALKHGCHGFEFDVRRIADGSLVVCHDPQFEGIEVARATPEQVPFRPRLDDVLRHHAKRAFLDIELKVEGAESEFLISLAGRAPQKGYVVSSFLPQVLLDLDLRSGHLPLGLICETPAQLAHWLRLPILYVIPHYSLVTTDLVKSAHDAGKVLLTWTVNDRSMMLRLAEMGVDGII
jgi:glycerophosphoryl diester phosphodiesterase